MKTSKRIIGTILGVFLGLFGSVSLFSGCKAEDEDKKYDVTIKIASDDGDEWIFPPPIFRKCTRPENMTDRNIGSMSKNISWPTIRVGEISGLLLRAEAQIFF